MEKVVLASKSKNKWFRPANSVWSTCLLVEIHNRWWYGFIQCNHFYTRMSFPAMISLLVWWLTFTGVLQIHSSLLIKVQYFCSIMSLSYMFYLIFFNEKQKWSTQIRGPNGVVSGLNKRFFAIKKTEKLHQCQIADQNHRRSIHIQN